MKHEVASLIQFPGELVEPEREDRLRSIRCIAWGFVFEIAVCMAVALTWGLRHNFR